MTKLLQDLLLDAKQRGVLNRTTAAARMAALPEGETTSNETLNPVETDMVPGPTTARDHLRPWTWPAEEYESLLAGRRWFRTQWGKAGGRGLILLIDAGAGADARAAHPKLPILDLDQAEALSDDFEGGASPEAIGAVLDFARAFGGNLELQPKTAEPVTPEAEIAEIQSAIEDAANWAARRDPTAGFPTGAQVRERFRDLAARLGTDDTLRLAEHCYARLVAGELELPAADSAAPRHEFIIGFAPWRQAFPLPDEFETWEQAAPEADAWGMVRDRTPGAKHARVPLPDGFTIRFPYCMECGHRHELSAWPTRCSKPASVRSGSKRQPPPGEQAQ